MGRRRIVQNDLEDFGAEEIGEASRAYARDTMRTRGRLRSPGRLHQSQAFLHRQLSPLHGFWDALIVSVRAMMGGFAIHTNPLITQHCELAGYGE